jgi:hypothetical protein
MVGSWRPDAACLGVRKPPNVVQECARRGIRACLLHIGTVPLGGEMRRLAIAAARLLAAVGCTPDIGRAEPVPSLANVLSEVLRAGCLPRRLKCVG